MWNKFSPNPHGGSVGDCAVRAVAAATGQSWEQAYIGLALTGFALGDMPSANRTWGAYLQKHGFKRRLVEADCTTCYTVQILPGSIRTACMYWAAPAMFWPWSTATGWTAGTAAQNARSTTGTRRTKRCQSIADTHKCITRNSRKGSLNSSGQHSTSPSPS